MIGCCKWLDRPTARLFCFVPKGEKTITKLGYFCRWINKKKKKNQKKTKKKKNKKKTKKKQKTSQRTNLSFFKQISWLFFFYLLSWCSSPGSRSRKFLQLTPHNGRYPTSRGLNIFSFYLFFFIFDFYLNTFFFFTSWCTFFGDVDDVTRKPSITQPVHLHFGIRQETNEEEIRRNKKK